MKAKVTGVFRPSPILRRGFSRRTTLALLLILVLGGTMLADRTRGTKDSPSSRVQSGTASAGVNLAAPPSLKTITVPRPSNLDMFVKSRPPAIALGKALFWDMQVGSDSVQACATCHFQAGADVRAKNGLNPGQNAVSPGTLSSDPDWTFQAGAPNGTLTANMFPFTRFRDPADRTTEMTRDWNDVVSSAGVHSVKYVGQTATEAVEVGIPEPDPVFNAGGLNTRRVPPRNAPTVVNAVFNFANFADGRANYIFNGSSPWGDADPDAGVWWADMDGVLRKHRVRITEGSLASQAVGPPLSSMEMSFAGRDFPEIARKLLNPHIVPLALQRVHPGDSVLGPLANSTFDSTGRPVLATGLKKNYEALVKAAFHNQFWNSGQAVTIGGREYTQMEANFSLFFGLAIALYESTLVSDDSPFDRFQAGDSTAMSASAQQGLNIFLTLNEPGGIGGSCITCHSTSTFSNASIMHVGSTNFGASLQEGLIERMIMGNLGGAWYDSGYYNIGVTPSDSDPGRGARDPFGNPLSQIERSILVANGQKDRLSFDPDATTPKGVVALPCGESDPFGRACPGDQRVATKGSFKVPTLRNVELTGPYFHNGGYATLMQVVDFYVRGGNYFDRNLADADADIHPLFGLNPNQVMNPGGLANPGSREIAEANQRKLVDFLLALTDERVRWEKGPFDHPEIFLPNGAQLSNGVMADVFQTLPPVGVDGRAAEGLSPLGTFLGLDPHDDPSAPIRPGFFWSVDMPRINK